MTPRSAHLRLRLAEGRPLFLGAVALSLVLGSAVLRAAQDKQPATGTPDAKTPGAQDQRPPRPEPTPPAPRPQEGTGGDPAKPAQAGPAPHLEVDALDHDFGAAIEGEKLSHVFKLKSNGQTDLVISNVKPTCGCTVAKVEVKKADGAMEIYTPGNPLPPGTELTVLAELNTQNKHNQASSKINIYCTDPRSIVTLGLTARVDTYFQITPNNLAFNEMSVADSAEKSFQVAGKKPGNFALSLEPKPLPDGMKVDLVPFEPDPAGKANRWDVKVTLGPNCREGNLGYPINLRSDEPIAGATPDKDGKAPTYGAMVMVTARVQGLISFEPQYLSFGLVRPGQVISRSLKLTSFDPNFTFKEPKIRLVGPNDAKPEFPYTSSFSQRVTPAPDGKSLTVELTLNGLPETADGSFQGRMIIETGHPQKPEIQVLLSGVCRAGVKVPPGPPTPPPAPVPPVGGQKQ